MNNEPIAHSLVEGSEFKIIFIVIGESCYVYKGEKFLNQLLLLDGVFPKPIGCIHFETIFLAKFTFGKDFSAANLWAVHPDILERLRCAGCLVENNVLAYS
jgi:hypothetical protein|tara:strand:+ start:5302 stop:5604 length:303 start_codon:yes stop_codon:yes gene_type:complete